MSEKFTTDVLTNQGAVASDVTLSVPNLTSLFANIDLLGNDLGLIGGIDSYIATLESLLDGKLFGLDIPIVGNALKSAADFLAPLKKAIDAIGPGAGIDQLQTLLYNALGPAGLNLLHPAAPLSAGETPAQLAVPVEYMLVNTSTFVPYTGGALPSPQTIQDIQFDLNLGGTTTVASLPLSGDLGLPGLGLGIHNGSVDVTVGWSLALDFGIDRNGSIGAYIATPANTNELSVNVQATLATGTQLTAELGFLAVTATQPKPGVPDPANPTMNALATGVGLQFAAGLAAGPQSVAGVRVEPIAALGGGSLPGVNVTFGGTAAVDLDLGLGFDLQKNGNLYEVDPQYPSFTAQLLVGGSGQNPWSLTSTNGSFNPSNVAAPGVSLNNIQFDFGAFLDKYVGSILAPIANALKPIEPILDFLNTKVPIFNEPLIEFIGSLEGGEVQNVGEFISFVTTILHYADYFNGNSGALKLSLGNFNLGSFDLRAAPGSGGNAIPDTSSLAGFNNLMSDLQNTAGALGFLSGAAIDDQANSASSSFAQFESQTGQGAITFPILDNPQSLIGLLFGQNVTLVHVVAPELTASAGFSISIPVWDLPPITVEIGGSIGIDLRFAAGYDTYGLVEAGSYIGGGGSDPGTIATDLLDGLYIDDTPTKNALGSTTPSTSVSILGSVSLSADVGIPGLLSAGVGGAVTLTITMSLKDSAPQDLFTPAYYKANNNDNKTRPSELVGWIEDFGNPLCAFNLDGAVSFQLILQESFLGFTATQTLVNVTLFDFSLGANCYNSFEPLGTQDANGVVTLYTGPLWQQRDVYTDLAGDIYTGASPPSGYYLVKGPTSEGGDDFNVTQQSPGTIIVTTTDGGKQTFENVTGLKATLGVGQNSLQIHSHLTRKDDGSQVNETLIGGTGNDTIIAGGGNDLIEGGGGDDEINAGTGSSTIYGGTPTSLGTSNGDTITGGTMGHNLIYGGAGYDLINPGGGNNTVFGGPSHGPAGGYSILLSSGGNSLLVGGTGTDAIQSNGGGNTLIGGGGNNMLVGGSGANLLYGGTNATYDNATALLLFGTPPAAPTGQSLIYAGAASLSCCRNTAT